MPAGFRIGIAASTKASSDWCARVEDLQVWSSPAIASTPPWGAEPAELPCFSASPLRSTPGPLPYQIAKTPAYLAPGNSPICWLPHTEVAASSSLIAGWNWMWFRSTNRRALHNAWSNPPKGEPRYPETKQAVFRPAARSHCRCIIGSRTSAWTPER